MKAIRFAVLAATLAGVGIAASAVNAAPRHRHQVCTVKWVHHHKVRRCFWR